MKFNPQLPKYNFTQFVNLVRQMAGLFGYESLSAQTQMEREMLELEMAALRAQMNPHFFSNMLTVIQRLVTLNRRMDALECISDLFLLMRMALKHTSKKTITLDEEMQLLELYGRMERARFGERLIYRIEIAKDIDISNTFLPPLLVQPFVENAIQHGVRNLDRPGTVRVIFRMAKEALVVIVEDDGVGMEKAQEYSGKQAQKESCALKICQKRIACINKHSDQQLSLQVIDLFDNQGEAAGTKAIITVQNESTQNHPH